MWRDISTIIDLSVLRANAVLRSSPFHMSLSVRTPTMPEGLRRRGTHTVYSRLSACHEPTGRPAEVGRNVQLVAITGFRFLVGPGGRC